jgi:tetratricopeptide (TPR) repeat protein
VKTTKIKPQLVVISGGIILFFLLFIFGKTVAKKNKPADNQEVTAGSLSFPQILTNLKKDLKPYQLDYVTRLENAVSRGDVKEQQIYSYHQLAAFWKDSISEFLPYAWYTGEAAKLENSEKSLTFAAHLMESRLMTVDNPTLQNWLGTNAKVLFEKALELNPDNDSSKIGLGACYMFGNISNNPMEGILRVRAIADKNPGNIYAQKMLVFGGIKTGQYDKAIERLKVILSKEPENPEMIALLGEAYERKGDKENAIIQYERLEKLVRDEAMKQDIRQHIEDLKKQK